MNKEEKEAIDKIEYYNNLRAVDLSLYYLDMQIATKTILNLIQKQEKIIEELKKDKLDLIRKHNVVKMQDVEEELTSMRNALEIKMAEMNIQNNMIDTCYIAKSKIKEKINQVEEEYIEFINSKNKSLTEKTLASWEHNTLRTVLEELLEEKTSDKIQRIKRKLKE